MTLVDHNTEGQKEDRTVIPRTPRSCTRYSTNCNNKLLQYKPRASDKSNAFTPTSNSCNTLDISKNSRHNISSVNSKQQTLLTKWQHKCRFRDYQQ